MRVLSPRTWRSAMSNFVQLKTLNNQPPCVIHKTNASRLPFFWQMQPHQLATLEG
jgi:hypothetical protein